MFEEEVQWVAKVSKLPVNSIEELQSGAILCVVADQVSPKSVPAGAVKAGRQGDQVAPFVAREYVCAFLKAAHDLGVPDHELFETEDLYDARDLKVVARGIRSYSRMASKQNPAIPSIGPLLGEKHQPPAFSSNKYAGWSEVQYGPMKGSMEGPAKLRAALAAKEEDLRTREVPVNLQPTKPSPKAYQTLEELRQAAQRKSKPPPTSRS